MPDLLGHHRYQLDDKGRVALPAKFREAFRDGVWLTVGLDGPLFAFPGEEWERLRSEIPVNPFDPRPDRDRARMFFSNADESRLDKQGRLLIPGLLREEVGLERDVVVIGVGNRLEIWPAEKWTVYRGARMAEYVEGSLAADRR